MTITIPTKPSSFGRSSERDLAKQQGTAEELRLAKVHAEQLKRDQDLEARSYGLCNVGSAVVRPATEDELYDAMLAEDYSTFNADGQVR